MMKIQALLLALLHIQTILAFGGKDRHVGITAQGTISADLQRSMKRRRNESNIKECIDTRFHKNELDCIKDTNAIGKSKQQSGNDGGGQSSNLIFVTTNTLKHTIGGFGIPAMRVNRSYEAHVSTTIKPLKEWLDSNSNSTVVSKMKKFWFFREGILAYCCVKWFQTLRMNLAF